MAKSETAPELNPQANPKRNKSLLGKSRIFTPEVVDDIHIKSELGRYRMRGFSLFKKISARRPTTYSPGIKSPN